MGCSNYYVGNPDNPQNEEIKDVDLYTTDDYFSKSPRVRPTLTPNCT